MMHLLMLGATNPELTTRASYRTREHQERPHALKSLIMMAAAPHDVHLIVDMRGITHAEYLLLTPSMVVVDGFPCGAGAQGPIDPHPRLAQRPRRHPLDGMHQFLSKGVRP